MMTRRILTLLVLTLGAASAQAQPPRPADLDVRALAANCAACHGTDGRAAPGSTVPGLAGLPRDRSPRRCGPSRREGARRP